MRPDRGDDSALIEAIRVPSADCGTWSAWPMSLRSVGDVLRYLPESRTTFQRPKSWSEEAATVTITTHVCSASSPASETFSEPEWLRDHFGQYGSGPS